MAKDNFRGHPVTCSDGKTWVYDDDGNQAGFNGKVRPCMKCGKLFEGSNVGDPDPCLGNLPGVDNACCGHGVREKSYIRFTNGTVITGFKITRLE